MKPPCRASRSSACGSSVGASPPTRSPEKVELDLRVRPAYEVDGRGRARLVHRHRRGAVARDAVPRAERLPERVAERREHVLDGVVLVDAEVAGRQQVEIEARVERAEREQVVEEANAGGDTRASLPVEVEREPESGLRARANEVGGAPGLVTCLGAQGREHDVILARPRGS